MPIRRPAKIPEAIVHLQQQLDQWRGAQKGREKLPESFWQAAVDLASNTEYSERRNHCDWITRG